MTAQSLRSTVAGLALVATLGLASTAQAAFVNGSLGGATFSGPVDLTTSFYSNNPNGNAGDIKAVTGNAGQSPANITTLVNKLLGGLTPPEGPLTLVGCFDSTAEGCTSSPNPVTVTGGGTTSGSVSDGSFTYAAIHAGNNEYLVEFSQAVTSFTFSGLAANFSNVRLFVPLPGAALLLGSGLLGLAWLRRRRGAGALDASGVAA